MGFVAALNFTQANGRCSLNGRQVSGLLPMISNDTDYEAAKANGYNFYGNYASNAVETNQWAPGSLPVIMRGLTHGWSGMGKCSASGGSRCTVPAGEQSALRGSRKSSH